MKLIEFKDGHGTVVFINPDKVSRLMHYRPKYTLVFFDSAQAESATKIVVQGEVEDVAVKLMS